jgi:hypothetical protein
VGGGLVLAVGRAMCGGLKWQPTIEPKKGNQQNPTEKATTAWVHKAGTFWEAVTVSCRSG